MPKSTRLPSIRLHGVRQNNLKNLDLNLPLQRFLVVTGLSGSGKSSLAFETLFAEGQRRYIETFSPYARQFFDRMDKPKVDQIEGIPPAIAIEQRNSVKTTRSTVGTMTEICDYMKQLWPHLARLHCRQCGQPVRKDAPQQIWEAVNLESSSRAERDKPAEVLVTFELPLSDKLSLDESLELITRQGYQRLLLDSQTSSFTTETGDRLRETPFPYRTRSEPISDRPCEILRIDEAAERFKASPPESVTIIQDRIKLAESNRARFAEACEQAYHFGKGRLAIFGLDPGGAPTASRHYSNHFHCAQCNLDYREPTPALFSFNHPLGACPACRGFGRIITIDYNRAMPDRRKSLAEGVVKPWQTGQGTECHADLLRFCKKYGVPTDVPFQDLPKKWQDWVINGDPDFGKDDRHDWPHAWYGVKGYFRWLESKAYKMHIRVLLSRYRAYSLCPECRGARFQPEALQFKVPAGPLPKLEFAYARTARSETAEPDRDTDPASRLRATDGSPLTLADFYQLQVRDAHQVVEQWAEQYRIDPSHPIGLVLKEVRSRLAYLVEVGMGYLTLDRPTRSLSGGETERVNLTACLGTRLVNTLFVLDEPSVGLHPRDTARLITILQRLRDAGNTVVVVEHEASVMRAADQIIDLGPGHGETGGNLVFQGPYDQILKSRKSLTGQYLAGKKQIPIPARRPVIGLPESPGPAKPSKAKTEAPSTPVLQLSHANLHNLHDLQVAIPLERFVCVTGVSGSGKTTLTREVLLPELKSRLAGRIPDPTDEEDEPELSDSSPDVGATLRLEGWKHLDRVVLVDQSLLGKTPRSNPAVYIGAFDSIRELFAQAPPARERGLSASDFSFNSPKGQCERCRGTGFEKIEMLFLSDVFIRCPECDGRRYRRYVLDFKLEGTISHRNPRGAGASPGRNRRATPVQWNVADLLEATVEEAIDFLRTWPESRQAKKAVGRLQWLEEVGLGYLRLGQPINTLSGGESQRLKLVGHLAEFSQAQQWAIQRTLFLFDEPTTGLHFDDVRVLLQVFQRLVEAGHSLVVIEHNLDVIKSADWIIDLGPEAGDQGGRLVAQGTPESIAACPESHTGRALKQMGL